MKEGSLTAHVIGVGVINITTGKTKFDWDIYDVPKEGRWAGSDSYAHLTDGGFLLLAGKNTFCIGKEEIILRDNDSQRKKTIVSEIIDQCHCNKVELLAMLKRHNYDYTPIRAFRSRGARNRKLQTSYSVKGTEYTKDWKKR